MKEGVALSQLADILPPPPPSGLDWILLGIVCLLVAVGSLWFLKKRLSRKAPSPARQAQRRIKALSTAWQAHKLSDREAAYRLATLLRMGLTLPQLSAHVRPNAVEDDVTWRETLKQLHALRYQDHPNSSLSNQYFERAERWLAAAQKQGR